MCVWLWEKTEIHKRSYKPDLKSPQHVPPPPRSKGSGEEGRGAHERVPRLTGTGVLPDYTEIRWEIQFLWNILKLEVWLIDALIAPLSTCPLFTVDSSRCGLDSAMGQCAQRGKKKNLGRRENIILPSRRGLLLHANRACC